MFQNKKRLSLLSRALVFFSVLLVTLVSFSFIGAKFALASSVGTVSIVTSSHIAADPNSTWTITFTTSSTGALTAGSGTITLNSTTAYLPGSPRAYLVNNNYLSAPPTSTQLAHVQTLVTPVNIGASQQVTIVIYGVVNPPAGSYPGSNFSVSTSADTTPSNASNNLFFVNGVTNVSFSTNDDHVGASSTWHIGFVTSATGNLTAGSSTINITFPAGISLPTQPSAYYVNNTAVSVNPVLSGADNNTVTITTPVSVNSNSVVSITVGNVTNPTTAQVVPYLSMAVSTSQDSVSVYPENQVPLVISQAPLKPLTFVVNTFSDLPNSNLASGNCITTQNNCSLRAAIQAANADNYDPVTILLGNGTYSLTIPSLVDNEDGSRGVLFIYSYNMITIQGSILGGTTINGGSYNGSLQDSLLFVSLNSTVSIDNVKFQNGLNEGAFATQAPVAADLYNYYDPANNGLNYLCAGGAIGNYGTLTITNSVISSNIDDGSDGCGVGGGIYNFGTLNLISASVESNMATASFGGGVDCDGTCNVSYSSISGNYSGSDGGGFDVDGTLNLANSTVANNASLNIGGGGIGCYSQCNIVNSTLAFNSTNQGNGPSHGGAIYIASTGVVNLSFSTVAYNTDTSSSPANSIYMASSSSTLNIVASIITSSGFNCNASAAKDLGYNIESDINSCGLHQSTDKTSTNPSIASSLSLSGGPTPVLLPNSNSPAIDAVPRLQCNDLSGNSILMDQRGFQRPVVGISGNADNCDVGSVEYNSGSIAPNPISWYHPLSPQRVCDTRIGPTPNQCTGQSLAAGSTLTLHLTSYAGIPATNVTSVVLNVTATNTSAISYLSIYPSGTQKPIVSSLNWSAQETIANLVTMGLSPGGDISIYNAFGNVDVAVDVEGYYSPSPYGQAYADAGEFNAVSLQRICDTRLGGQVPSNQCNANGTKLGTLSQGQTLTFNATNLAGIPSTGVAAVVLNVTAINPTGLGGFLTIYPAGQSQPIASNINFSPGETIANRVIVPVGTNGEISVYNYSGNTDIAVDVNGYFADGTQQDPTGLVFESFAPFRACDTRTYQGNNTPCAGKTLGAGNILSVNVGVGAALAGNATATGGTSTGYLSIYPANQSSPPLISDLNYTAGQSIPNMLIVAEGTGSFADQINVYNPIGTVNFILDISGYFVAII